MSAASKLGFSTILRQPTAAEPKKKVRKGDAVVLVALASKHCVDREFVHQILEQLPNVFDFVAVLRAEISKLLLPAKLLFTGFTFGPEFGVTGLVEKHFCDVLFEFFSVSNYLFNLLLSNVEMSASTH